MKKRDGSLLLFILLLSCSLIALLFIFKTENPSKPPSALSTREMESLVNKHLSQTSQKIEDQQQKIMVQMSSLPRVGDQLFPHKDAANEEGVDFSADAKEQGVLEDLNRYPKDHRNMRSANTVILNEVADNEKADSYSQAYKDEYAQKFIENAKKNGYLVKLNNDLVVISVQKIKPSNQIRITPPDSSGSQ